MAGSRISKKILFSAISVAIVLALTMSLVMIYFINLVANRTLVDMMSTVAETAANSDGLVAIVSQAVLTSIVVTIVLLVIFALIFSLFIRSIVSEPLRLVTINAHRLSLGQFIKELPPRLVSRGDEIGELCGAFISMSDSVRNVIQNIDLIFLGAKQGKLNVRADTFSLFGDYQRIVTSVNTTLDVICAQLDAVTDAIALFNGERQMVYFNHAMGDFLKANNLLPEQPDLLAYIVSSGSSTELDPGAALLFDFSAGSSGKYPAEDPSERQSSSPLAFNAAISMGDEKNCSSYALSLCRAKSDGKKEYSGGGILFTDGMYVDNDEVHADDTVCVMLILSDVTSLTRAKTLAETASRAKNEFMSRMSHEIRTPINAIAGMIQIARASDDIEKIKNCIEQIDSSSSHLLSIIDDILDFSKIEAGKLSLEVEDFDLVSDIDFVISMMESHARERQISLRLEIGEIVNNVLTTDSLRLNQILINLLSNAIKFSQQDSKVTLTVKELEHGDGYSEYFFEVVDHGTGISESQKQKLFKPFEQADGRISRLYGGIGLGLVISNSLVDMLGGKLNLESKEGEGSTFSFTIRCPAKPQKAALKVHEKREDMVSFDFSGKRCLVVDDIEINREIVQELLAVTAISMDLAENGKQAVEKFSQSPEWYFDIILMDMQMPGIDGCTATRRIRALERGDAKSIPIIAMTANVMKEDIRQAMDSGMNAHLAKPVDLESLCKMLEHYLPDN